MSLEYTHTHMAQMTVTGTGAEVVICNWPKEKRPKWKHLHSTLEWKEGEENQQTPL